MTDTLVEVVTTVSSEEQAVALADELLDAGLVACVHVEKIRSIYRWQGSRCDEGEVRLTLKTTLARAADVEERVRERHPYETPMIVTLGVHSANPEYVAWVRRLVEGERS